MGMYNMVFGTNPGSGAILATLGLTTSDFGRFRDCWVEANGESGHRIAVYTRCGGGNRDDYEEVFDQMGQHPLFLHDSDDDFDPTYATFYFRLPEQYADVLRSVATGEPVDMDKVWTDAIAALEKGTKPSSA